MSKVFDTVDIHKLIDKLIHTNILNTIIFIANYIKGYKAYSTIRNTTSTQLPFKTCVPQGGVLSPTDIPMQHTHLDQEATSYSTQTKRTLFTHDPAEYNSRLNMQIYNAILDMYTYSIIVCFTFDPELIYN